MTAEFERYNREMCEDIMVEEVRQFTRCGGKATQENIIFASCLQREIIQSQALLNALRTGKLEILELRDPILDESVIGVKKI